MNVVEFISLYIIDILSLYGEDIANVIWKGIMVTPAITIPVVSSRMEEKVSEWRVQQYNFQAGWREIFDKNYSKSLDALSASGLKIFDVKDMDQKSIAAAITKVLTCYNIIVF